MSRKDLDDIYREIRKLEKQQRRIETMLCLLEKNEGDTNSFQMAVDRLRRVSLTGYGIAESFQLKKKKRFGIFL